MIKVLDCFGNKLDDGDTIAWLLPNGQRVLCVVKRCVPPGAIDTVNRTKSQGSLKLELELGVEWTPDAEKKGFVELPAFIKTFDPESQSVLESSLSRMA